MSSSGSPSPDSSKSDLLEPPDPLRMGDSDRTKQRLAPTISAARWRGRKLGLNLWPVLFLIPALIAIVQAAAIVPFVHLIFGESFGLTMGREAPWAGGLAVLGLLGFYSTLLIGRFVTSNALAQIAAALCWVGGTLAWLATVPGYDVAGLFADPMSIVSERGYFAGMLFLAMGCWWQGIRYASNDNLIDADEIRAMIQRCWGILLLGILFAALMNNESANTAISALRLAVPITVIASLALIAAAETQSTREIALSRGAKGPNWDRWARIVGSVTGLAAIVSVIIIFLLGPDALAATIDGILAAARLVGLGLAYILFALFYLVYQFVRAVYYLLQLIFGDFDARPPEMPVQPGGANEDVFGLEEQESGTWEYAELIRLIGLILAVLVVGLIVFRISRRSSRKLKADNPDETRDSVFSSGLLKDQLKGLFRRRSRDEGPRILDLTTVPTSVRESFLYVHVLANRQLVPRHDEETPDDFARRLRAVWPGTADSLRDLTSGYQRVRYGEFDDSAENPDLPGAQRAWTSIWEKRKDWVPPESDED